MNLVKKLIVGTSLGVLLGAGHIALSDEDIVSRENAQRIRIYLAALAGTYLSYKAVYSKPVDRALEKAKRVLITQNPYL